MRIETEREHSDDQSRDPADGSSSLGAPSPADHKGQDQQDREDSQEITHVPDGSHATRALVDGQSEIYRRIRSGGRK